MRDHEAALVRLATLKDLKRNGEADYKERVKDPINAVRNFMLSIEHQIVDPLDSAITIYETKALAYSDEQTRIAAEQQAEIDRKERERLERERAKEAEQKAREAKRERDPIAKQELQREAEIIRATPVPASSGVTVAPRTASASSAGLTPKDNWVVQVFDEKALRAAVKAGKISDACLCVDEKFLGEQARSMKERMNVPINDAGDMPWPGVRAVNDRGFASKGRRR